jgi:RNA polymerase sigma-70 factor (ECF subfamily)
VRPEIEQAIELIQRKDEKSLEQALELLQNTIFSFSMNVCGQRQDAEDTMQEVLVQSISKLPKFENPKALVVWLYKVAKSRCLMSRRKSKFAPKEALSLDELMPDRRELAKLAAMPDATPESAVLRRENAKRLRDAVQKLPPDHRLVLVLHDMEDLSDQEIAEITGLEPGTIRVRLHRARLFVRKELANRKQATAAPPLMLVAGLAAQARSGKCKQLFAELSDYLDDKLDDSLCDELEKHLRGCEPCEAFLGDLERSIEQCRTAQNAAPDPIRAAKIRRELLAQYEQTMKGAIARKRTQETVPQEQR